VLSEKLNITQNTKLYKRMYRRLFRRSRKRIIRYGLLAANAVVLAVVVVFVARNPASSQTISKNSLASNASDQIATNPLDQLSSADIAVHVARLTNLYETNSVTNNADSLNAQLTTTSSNDAVVAKPQVVATAQKSIKDIQQYVTVPGDTIASIAAKFSVSSDSLRWSNAITGNTVSAGKQLWISPISDGIVYVVKAGDTPANLADKFRTSKEQIIEFNDAETSGLTVGMRIVIPGGRQPAATGYSVASFAWGGYTPVYGSNGYDYGWCTWYAAIRRAQIGRPVPSNLGNAYSWYRLAQRAGLPTGFAPAVGAVAVNEGGNHVSVVEQVNGDGSFWVSEMNSRGQVSINDPTPAGGWNRIDYKMYTSVGYLKFIY
jgi:surface antigen